MNSTLQSLSFESKIDMLKKFIRSKLRALISRFSMIVQVNVVLNRIAVDSDGRFDNLGGCHFHSESELYLVLILST